MPDITIKTASVSDSILIETLAREIWMQHYPSIITIQQIDFMLSQFQSAAAIQKDMEGGMVYDIAFSDGDPCGYSAVFPDQTGLFLSKLYVKQSCRRQGVAKSLLYHIEQRAKESGISRIWLKCNKNNTGSLKAYERLGFSVAYSCVTDIGSGFVMDDYALEKFL